MRAKPRRIRRHGLTQSRTWALVLGLGLLGLGASACNPDDTGNCCTVVSGFNPDLIPKAEKSPSGEYIDAIKQDPAFDCSNLTCVSYKGTPAFCTRQCKDADGCPEGFACETVLQSDPGPGSQIRPEDKFCVKVGHICEP